MFTDKFTAILSAPKGKLKDRKGRSTRTIEFVLKTDMDDSIKEGLDGSGKEALKGLQSRGLSKVEIPFDTVGANIKLKAGDVSCVIKGAHGIKIIGKANMNEEDAAPICEIHWRIPFNQETWAFLGAKFGETVDVKLSNQQTVMAFDSEDGGEEDDDAAEAPAPKKPVVKKPDNVTPIGSAGGAR